MIHFTRNSGQFHPSVAYVAVWPDDLPYPGAGVGRLILDGPRVVGFRAYGDCEMTDDLSCILVDGQAVPWDDEMGAADFDALLPGVPHAVVSCHEVVVAHGTAAAALLNLVGDHS